jgi:putative phosphoesterase
MTQYPQGTIFGLLSDSHGDARRTRRAVNLLVEDHRADVLVHLGDVESVDVIDALAGYRAHLVFGNCDWNWQVLGQYARSLGIVVDHPCGRIKVGKRSIVFSHGHDEMDRVRAIESGASYYCQGHSHVCEDKSERLTRLLNPGALFRASCYTVAWLDPVADRFEFVPVEP